MRFLNRLHHSDTRAVPQMTNFTLLCTLYLMHGFASQILYFSVGEHRILVQRNYRNRDHYQLQFGAFFQSDYKLLFLFFLMNLLLLSGTFIFNIYVSEWLEHFNSIKWTERSLGSSKFARKKNHLNFLANQAADLSETKITPPGT